jgi:hypothetical protein
MRLPRTLVSTLVLLAACSQADDAPGASGKSVSQWPDPLPAHADDVPFMHKGLIVGSWPPDEEHGFDHEWLDEEGLREVFTMHKASRRSWRGFTSSDAIVPTDSLLTDRRGAMIGYVYSLISRVDESGLFADQPAVLHVSHRGRVRIRIDGRVVVDEPATPDGDWREVRVGVTLTGPYDVVLAKLSRGDDELGASMGLKLRVSAPDGSALPGQDWNTMRPPGIPSDL